MKTIRPVYLAIIVMVGMYVGTTALGAALFATPFGLHQLQLFMWPEPVPTEKLTLIGSPLYWALLVSLPVIASFAALAIEAGMSKLKYEQRQTEVPIWIPMALASLCVSFCLYKLAMAEGLTASELWDRSVCFDEKMTRRAELISLLGNRYYAVAYSSLPILASFLLAAGIMKKDRTALISFFVLAIVIIWLDIAMIMKSPAIIFVGLVGVTLVLSGFGWIKSFAVTAPMAIGIFSLLSWLQFCDPQLSAIRMQARSETAHTTLKANDHPLPETTTRASPDPTNRPDDNTRVDRAIHLIRNAALRMAASYPYYVQTFSNPDERCGLELPHNQSRKCFGPTKVFSRMYPSINSVVGSAPAATTISAFAEVGPIYSIFAAVACGLIIGALSFFARGRDPLSISIAVAICIYAYYVSQVSLTGSLIDSYGLLWLLLPIAAMTGIAALWRVNIRLLLHRP